MNRDPQKAKITIELEDGSKAEFVAVLRCRERTRFDPPLSRDDISTLGDREWRGVKLPKPPEWAFEGRTIGVMTMTMP